MPVCQGSIIIARDWIVRANKEGPFHNTVKTLPHQRVYFAAVEKVQLFWAVNIQHLSWLSIISYNCTPRFSRTFPAHRCVLCCAWNVGFGWQFWWKKNFNTHSPDVCKCTFAMKSFSWSLAMFSSANNFSSAIIAQDNTYIDVQFTILYIFNQRTHVSCSSNFSWWKGWK